MTSLHPPAAFDGLLALQDHDAAADRLQHRLDTQPEREALTALDKDLGGVESQLGEVEQRLAAATDIERRLEQDLTGLETKLAEIDRRLYSGDVTATRELLALQADVESMKRHRSTLEDRVLEAMGERETIEAEAAELRAQRDALDAEGSRLRAVIAETSAAIEAELVAEHLARDDVAATLPAELLELYEQLRARLDGVGAARLVQGRCSGCHLTLPATELDRVKRQPPGVVVRCDQCGRILVRT